MGLFNALLNKDRILIKILKRKGKKEILSSKIRSKIFMYVQQSELLPFKDKEALKTRLKSMVKDDTIKNYALILHNNDTNKNGEKIKPHYHVWLYSEDRISIGKIAKNLGDNEQQFESMTKRGNSIQSSAENSLLYMIHETPNSQNKYQYNSKDVEANFNYQKFVSKLKEKNSKERVTLSRKPNSILNDFKNEKIDKNKAIEELMAIGAQCYAKYANQLDKIEDGLRQLRFKKWVEEKKKTKEKIKIVWAFGAAGTGKTHYCCDFFEKRNIKYFMTTGSNDPFQDYDGQKALIIDELRPDTFRYRDLLQILDPYNFEQKKTVARYHNARIMSDYIFVNSPYDPLTFYSRMNNKKQDGFDQLYRRIGLILRFTDEKIQELDLDFNGYYTKSVKENKFSKKYMNDKNKFTLDDLEEKL